MYLHSSTPHAPLKRINFKNKTTLTGSTRSNRMYFVFLCDLCVLCDKIVLKTKPQRRGERRAIAYSCFLLCLKRLSSEIIFENKTTKGRTMYSYIYFVFLCDLCALRGKIVLKIKPQWEEQSTVTFILYSSAISAPSVVNTLF